MEKKEYTTPELTLMGDVEDITKGQGRGGRDDQIFLSGFGWFHWGPRDQTSG